MRQLIALAERQQYHDSMQAAPYCPECGAQTLTACENCKHRMTVGRRPAYCTQCGKPFPWTETAIQAAEEYTDELDNLNLEDKKALKETITDLTVDTPRTEVAVHRFTKFMAKIGPAGAKALWNIVVEIGTAEAKKKLGL